MVLIVTFKCRLTDPGNCYRPESTTRLIEVYCCLTLMKLCKEIRHTEEHGLQCAPDVLPHRQTKKTGPNENRYKLRHHSLDQILNHKATAYLYLTFSSIIALINSGAKTTVFKDNSFWPLLVGPTFSREKKKEKKKN